MQAFPRLALAALLAAVPAQAGVASLVYDLTPQDPPVEGRAANPYRFSAAGDRLVFAAADDAHGGELWTSDGTSGGTEILEDVCPGECGSITHLAGQTPKLSFWVLDSPGALWRSDGTRAGTFPLLDSVHAGGLDGRQSAVRGDVLFIPRCLFPDCGLWRTDGTVAGTREVLDLEVNHVALVGDRVLASTDDEIWRLDPGSETPVRVLSPIRADFLSTVQGRLLMIVSNDDGQELWSTDGTAAGTRPLTQFANADPFGFHPNVHSTGGRLYFVADDVQHGNELWASDGTPQGTKRITDFGYYFPFVYSLSLTLQETAGGRVVFEATDGLSEERQLWSTDGRPESTAKLLEPCPRECHPADIPPPYRTARAGNTVLFPAIDAAHGTELWTTDGTVKGTRLFLDLCPGPCDSRVRFVHSTPTAAGGVYFSALNHLWWTDGTVAGTRRLTDQPLQWFEVLEPAIAELDGKTYVKLGADDGGRLGLLEDGAVLPLTFGSGLGSGSEIERLFAHGGEALFLLDNGSEPGFWRSAGTAGTTRLVDRDVSEVESPISAGGIFYFFERDELRRATDEGTVLIAEVTDDFFHGSGDAAALGSTLYFSVYRDGSSEIWKTDGTAAGTVAALDLPSELHVSFMAASGGRLYLGLYEEGEEWQRLWTSDGTAAGTREILVLGGFRSVLDRFVRVGGYDWFVDQGYDRISHLWRTDGTAAGTVAVSLADGPVRIADAMIAHQGSLYVLGEDYDYPYGTSALWRVDGDIVTRLGTFGEHPPSQVLDLAPAGNLVLFNVNDGQRGIELWATDGTPAGTRLVRDVAPGPFSSDAGSLTPIGGKVFFSARDHAHGFELWESDGTAAGTRLAHDVAPGPASSSPRALTAAEGRLYFTADDGLTGRELWSLSLNGPGCESSARALCLQGGRFRVEASWRDFQGNAGAGTAVPLTGDTGYFWFFDPANAEVILKVLDGRGLNGHHWVFYGALSSVEYTLTVTDTQTGLTARYVNPMGQLASVGDTTGFGPNGAFASQRASTALASPPALVRGWTSAAAVPCVPGPQRLCLNGGRFAVEASWRVAGKNGKGTAVPLTGDAGYFWFFDAANVEVLLKVLDGRPVTGKFWVFYGALSNVEYTLTVTDSLTGEVKEYRNPSGRFASVADTGAF